MPEAAKRVALQMADYVIDRHLVAAFAQLDAGTSDVVVRKLVYARLVERSLAMACARLPDQELWAKLERRLSGDQSTIERWTCDHAL